ncbi:thermonuclease family protein [Thalassospira sp.]|uniref:thermonuclease family protein n=1 Tax=Thalassospira sp. TaxID=1912094 RepID=UPI000C480124|nr:thermonuclease family protein [Thalassospira sp.]MBC06603.1 nuclease [Thalassospira sp.]
MKRVARLIILLAIPAIVAFGLHWRSTPVHAADNTSELADPGGLVAKGRDVHVIDGDTIMIAGQVVDIAGMDAPELGQQCLHNGSFWDCGMSSAMQLRKYFAMAPFDVHCWAGDAERAGKADDFPIVECGIGERDVAAAMISDGEALPIAGYSHRYDRLSREADNAGIGIHGGDMIAPADWRAGKRLDGETGRCLFIADGKGNYLSTLDPRFADLTQTSSKICSDEEAREMALNYLPPAP